MLPIKKNSGKAKNIKELIALLIQLKNNNFPVLKVNECMNEKPGIIELCSIMRNKLIKHEATPESETQSFKDILQGMSIFPLIHFSSDLLQFYVLMCQKDLDPEPSLESFNQYIKERKGILGDSEDNLFILEYKVITAYNDLVNIQGAFESGSFTDAEANNALAVHLDRINKIKSTIDNQKERFPDNTFIFYLSLVLHYCDAKALEIQCQVNEASYEESKIAELVELQDSSLINARKELEKIQHIQQFAADTGQSYVPGEQFSFGCGMFRKLPFDSSELISEHIETTLRS